MSRILVLSICLILGVCTVAQAAPKAGLIEHWKGFNESSREVVDHSAWDSFLEKYVSPSPDGINRVAYSSVSKADRAALDSYISGLEAIRVTGLNRAEQKAYWINLYNALTVKVILDHYPVKSIKDIDISPGFFSFGPWDAELLTIEGMKVSLNNIEHGILRPIWRDNRVHYAVNCASLGCPNLRQRAYTSGNMEEMLESGAREYINHPRGARVKKGKLVVSSIYEWFKQDFEGSDEGVIKHLRKYADRTLLADIVNITRINDDEYNWELNEIHRYLDRKFSSRTGKGGAEQRRTMKVEATLWTQMTSRKSLQE